MSRLLPALVLVTGSAIFLAGEGRGADLTRCEAVTRGKATVVTFPSMVSAGQAVGPQGILMRPSGRGPFPGVVLLHRVFGVELPVCFQSEMEQYRSWGYVVLLVDSNSLPRTFRSDSPETLSGYSQIDQATDALGAVRHLASLPFVDSSHIIVVGHAFGGSAAIRAASPSIMRQQLDDSTTSGMELLSGVVAWHPACPSEIDVGNVPVLIVIGERDSINSARACTTMHVTGNVEIQVVSGVGHNFDVDWFSEYDASATRHGYELVADFLAAIVGIPR